MTDRIDQEGRAAFVSTLPRKITELRATLGTLVADPRSTRMRDELRRRFNALYSLTRSYGLPQLSDGLREGIAHLDAIRGAAQLSSRDLDTLAETIASLSSLAQRDLPDHPELFSRRGATASAPITQQNTSPTAEPPPAAAGAVHRETLIAQPAVRAPAPPVAMAPRTETLAQFPGVKATDAPATSEAPRTRTALVFPAVVAPTPETAALPSATASALQSTPPTSSPPLGLLVVGPGSLARQVSTVVTREADVHAVTSFAEAVSAARDTAPDVILAACAAPADGLALLAALRGDPLTDFLPVVLLAEPNDGVDAERARENGAADFLVQPSNEALRASIDRCAHALLPAPAPPPALREVTLEELTRTLSDEIRRGLLDAAGPRGNRAKVPLDGGSEVLAATWAAIARVREIVEKRTQGRVRFELPAAPLGTGGAHVLALGDDASDDERATARDAEAGDDPLPERRALVVDDDPAVVRFFAGLLREAGMEVLECGDGSTALDEARRSRPDVIVSDILMPGLDGFALCGAIRRDVALRHTPIVLLSWKDDLLLWMREMGAQAQGYLRKEARAEAILARVRSVLRPRVRLLRRLEALSDTRELRGRVERVGAFALLETVARSLLDANLVVVDAHSSTELSLRGGTVVRATRLAADGTRVEGETALVRMLGVSNARFSVQRDARGVQRNVEGDLPVLLQRGARQLTALEGAVSSAALLEVSSVELDVTAAMTYAQGLPASMRALVERVAAGEGPRSLLLRDKVAPDELEPLMVELVRAGVVRGLRGPAGQDLVAMRAAAQDEASNVRPAVKESASPSAAEWSLAAAPHAPHVEAAFAAKEHESSRSGEWSPPTNADEAARPGFGVETEGDSLASAVLRELRAPRDDEPVRSSRPSRPAPRSSAVPPAPTAPSDGARVEAPIELTTKREPKAEELATPEAQREIAPAEAPKESSADLSPVAGLVELDARGLPRTRPVTAPPPAGEGAKAPTAVAHRVGTTNDSIIVDEDAVGAPVSVHEPGPEDEVRENTSPVGHKAASGPSDVALLVGVVALGALSFFGVRAYLQYSDVQPSPVTGRASAVSTPSTVPTARASVQPTTRPVERPAPSATVSPSASSAPSAEPTGAVGPLEPSPASASAVIEEPTEAERSDLVPGRALMTVRGVADELEYDHRPLGAAPRSVQLPPATSVVLTYRRGPTTGFVLVTLEAGRATRVELPPP